MPDTPSASTKTALITGGTRGIGRGIAEALAAKGFALALTGRRPASDVAETLDALRAGGAAAVSYHASDVADLSAHEDLVAAVVDEHGRLDCLVNNAGIAPDVRADILEAGGESFDRLIGVNLKGPYFLTQAAAKQMIRQGEQDPAFEGVVVNVGSISATVASVNRGDYCISKAGVAMATALWAARLGEFRIGVFEVRPGVTATDMTAGVKQKYDELFANGLTAVKRWGEPADTGAVVAAMCSGGWLYATGTHVMVDGGLTIPRL